jgi:hypothetical protein
VRVDEEGFRKTIDPNLLQQGGADELVTSSLPSSMDNRELSWRTRRSTAAIAAMAAGSIASVARRSRMTGLTPRSRNLRNSASEYPLELADYRRLMALSRYVETSTVDRRSACAERAP